MYESDLKGDWLTEADKLAGILVKIQNNDGGFDVGYNYKFGSTLLHKKGQSLACESTALLVLDQLRRTKYSGGYDETISKGLDWILLNSIKEDDGHYSIPYCPGVTKEIVILNGISFTVASLGMILKDDTSISNDVYLGMLAFLKDNMLDLPDFSGKYWPYFDQKSTVISEIEKKKVDYYHLAQQVEVHSLAQQYNPSDIQYEIILNGADHLADIQKKLGIIPYDNLGLFDGYIHSWGLSSVIPAMIEASRVIPENKNNYHSVAQEVMEWLINNAWNGEYFYDILTPDGNPVSHDYMVRSDAWCFQAFSSFTKAFGAGRWTDAGKKCFERLKEHNFSGKEKHGKKSIQIFLEQFQKR
jgi:hypothetical protein